MKILHDSINIRAAYPNIKDPLLPEGYLLFDIETTGFSPKYQTIYMIGYGILVQEELNIYQLFAESPREETQILEQFAQILSDARGLVTFNGQRFDLPFCLERANGLGIELSFSRLNHIDLFRLAKSFDFLLHLSSYRQKSIESYLSIERKDQKTGGELIDIYRSYVKHADPSLLELLCIHNHDDVAALYPLLLLNSFEALSSSDFYLERWQHNDRELLLEGKLNLTLPALARYQSDCLHIQLEDNQLRAVIPLQRGQMRYELANPKDYYYLPEEDIVIPKALGESIDKSRRRQATAKNACIKKEGLFFPLCKDISFPYEYPLFHMDYRSPQSYVLFPETNVDDFLSSYMKSCLRAMQTK